MTLFGLEIVVAGTVVGATTSYLIYRRMVSYHRLLDKMSKLVNEDEKAKALGIDDMKLQQTNKKVFTSIAAMNVRQEEVRALAYELESNQDIANDPKISLLEVVNNADSYRNLFDFQHALLENIISESSYLSNRKSHIACIKLMTEDPRFNLQGTAYYASFGSKLDQRVFKNQNVDESILLQSKLNEAETAMRNQQKALATANANVGRLKQQLEGLCGKNTKLEAELKEALKEAKQYLEQLENEKVLHDKTQQLLHNVQEELQGVKGTNFKLQRKLRDLEKELRTKDEEILRLKETVARLEREGELASAKLEELSSKLKDRIDIEVRFEARIQELESRLNTANTTGSAIAHQRERDGLNCRKSTGHIASNDSLSSRLTIVT